MNVADLDEARRARLLAAGRRVTLGRGETAYVPGDPADRVYLVETGRMKIVRTSAGGAETIVGIRTAGEIFGELSAIEPARVRSTAAIAIEPAAIRAIPATVITELLSQDAVFARAFCAGLVRRLTDAERELTELAGKSVPGRLVDALGRLAAMYGEDAGDGTVRIGINLTHRDLADLIGTSRETLTKELSVLADVGLVRVTHRTVTLVQPQAFPFARRDAS